MARRFGRLHLLTFLATATLAAPVLATQVTVDLSAEAIRSAPNDRVNAAVSAEATGATPGSLSLQVNNLIEQARKTAKMYPSVKLQSGTTSTQPIYDKDGKIASWRMRSELVLESGDMAAFSELLGRLQDSLGVSKLMAFPAPNTRKAVEDAAVAEAINAFKARAQLITKTLGKSYKIKNLSINTNRKHPQPAFRGTANIMTIESSTLPLEAGESEVSANVSGQIEVE